MANNMFSKLKLSLVATGALAIAAVSWSGYANAASKAAVATTEFSAQQNKDDPKNKKPAGAPKGGQQGQQQHNNAPRNVERRVTPQGGGQKNFEVKKNIEIKRNNEPRRNIEVKKNIEIKKNIEVQKNINNQNKLAPVGGSGSGTPKTAHKTFTPRGAKSHVVIAARIRGVPARGAGRTAISGRNYSVWRSGYRVRRGGNWRTFVALGTLGALTIGAAEYYPYAYIEAPQDYCDGLTEDGCQLVFDEVETMEGDVVGQCVAYCPWR
jgi:hypothetical protein